MQKYTWKHDNNFPVYILIFSYHLFIGHECDPNSMTNYVLCDSGNVIMTQRTLVTRQWERLNYHVSSFRKMIINISSLKLYTKTTGYMHQGELCGHKKTSLSILWPNNLVWLVLKDSCKNVPFLRKRFCILQYIQN